MKDIIGREIEVGDLVAVASAYDNSASLTVGYVLRFTNTRVYVIDTQVTRYTKATIEKNIKDAQKTDRAHYADFWRNWKPAEPRVTYFVSAERRAVVLDENTIKDFLVDPTVAEQVGASTGKVIPREIVGETYTA